MKAAINICLKHFTHIHDKVTLKVSVHVFKQAIECSMKWGKLTSTLILNMVMKHPLLILKYSKELNLSMVWHLNSINTIRFPDNFHNVLHQWTRRQMNPYANNETLYTTTQMNQATYPQNVPFMHPILHLCFQQQNMHTST